MTTTSATAQRSTSDGGDLTIAPPPLPPDIEDEAQVRADRLKEQAERWADQTGRMQIRVMADKSDEAQLAWWKSLTAAQRAALLAKDPGALFGLDGLPAEVRADARTAYIDSVREDIEISSHEDELKGELDIAWVHLGVDGSAKIASAGVATQ